MKKIYRQYSVQKRKNNKWHILGIDEEYKSCKVEECLSEDEANTKRSVYQKKSSIYYDLNTNINNTVNNYKARLNKADLVLTDFDELLESVLQEFRQNLIRKRVLVSNIINTSISSSRANSKTSI